MADILLKTDVITAVPFRIGGWNRTEDFKITSGDTGNGVSIGFKHWSGQDFQTEYDVEVLYPTPNGYNLVTDTFSGNGLINIDLDNTNPFDAIGHIYVRVIGAGEIQTLTFSRFEPVSSDEVPEPSDPVPQNASPSLDWPIDLPIDLAPGSPWFKNGVVPQTETPRDEASPLILDLGAAGIGL